MSIRIFNNNKWLSEYLIDTPVYQEYNLYCHYNISIQKITPLEVLGWLKRDSVVLYCYSTVPCDILTELYRDDHPLSRMVHGIVVKISESIVIICLLRSQTVLANTLTTFYNSNFLRWFSSKTVIYLGYDIQLNYIHITRWVQSSYKQL